MTDTARRVVVGLTVAAGMMVGACGLGDGDDRDEMAAHRCEPTSSGTADLLAVFPQLGSVTSAKWCARAMGAPDTARVTVPGPHDWGYYGVVHLADTVAAEGWGQWQAIAGPPMEEMPSALRSLVPEHGRWSYNGAGAYLDRSSATIVLSGASG